MANSVSAAYKSVQPNRTQAYLREALVSDVITKAEFGNVSPAQNIKFPYMNSVKVQDYLYQTGNPRTDITQVADSYQIDQAKTAVAGYDRIQNLQMQNPSWVSMIEEEMGFQLARNVDQTVIQTGIDASFTNVAGGGITAGALLALMANTAAYLTEARAFPGMRFWIMDPLRAALLPQMDASSGFVRADQALVKGMNGYQGQEAVGFKILVSNELEYTVVLSLETNPTAGQTITLGGFTWTFVANGTAAAAGEISLGTGGGALATTQANLVAAVNGTGTPGASTYIDVSAEDRIDIDNSGLALTSFSSDDTTITKFGRINGSTNTPGTFGIETSEMLAGVAGAIDMTMLQTPLYDELPAQVAAGSVTHARDMIMTTLWGSGVWHRNARSLAAISFNA